MAGNVIDHAFYVTETRTTPGGQRVIEHASGRFDDADEARQACIAMRQAEPDRVLHCVEATVYD